MARIRYTEPAKADLDYIYHYISSDNPEAARKLIASIRTLVRKIADHPGMGRTRDELLPGIRSIPRGNYVIFYTVAGSGIRVVRVLHGAQDIGEGHFA